MRERTEVSGESPSIYHMSMLIDHYGHQFLPKKALNFETVPFVLPLHIPSDLKKDYAVRLVVAVSVCNDYLMTI